VEEEEEEEEEEEDSDNRKNLKRALISVYILKSSQYVIRYVT